MEKARSLERPDSSSAEREIIQDQVVSASLTLAPIDTVIIERLQKRYRNGRDKLHGINSRVCTCTLPAIYPCNPSICTFVSAVVLPIDPWNNDSY